MIRKSRYIIKDTTAYWRRNVKVHNIMEELVFERVNQMYNQVKELLDMPDRAAVWQERRQKMLSEKIDYAKFLTWFIEAYPDSANTMRKNPDYQWRFK